MRFFEKIVFASNCARHYWRNRKSSVVSLFTWHVRWVSHYLNIWTFYLMENEAFLPWIEIVHLQLISIDVCKCNIFVVKCLPSSLQTTLYPEYLLCPLTGSSSHHELDLFLLNFSVTSRRESSEQLGMSYLWWDLSRWWGPALWIARLSNLGYPLRSSQVDSAGGNVYPLFLIMHVGRSSAPAPAVLVTHDDRFAQEIRYSSSRVSTWF